MWLEIFILMKYENFYLEFKDYKDVKVYEYVKGVIFDVYFLNYNEVEIDYREIKSKFNIYEVKFVKWLCRYFF